MTELPISAEEIAELDQASKTLQDALHLTEHSSLLVGNLNQHRTSWLVISVLDGTREEPGLFPLGDAA